MADEYLITLGSNAAGWTVYANLFDPTWNGSDTVLGTVGFVRSGTSWIADSWANRAAGATTLTESATVPGTFTADLESSVTAVGTYKVVGKHQLTGSRDPQNDETVTFPLSAIQIYGTGSSSLPDVAGVWRCAPSSESQDAVYLYKTVGDTRWFAFDLGDLEEIIAGESITDATITSSGDVTISVPEIGSYRVVALFSGGTASTQTVTMTAYLSGGGTIVRSGLLVIT